MSDQGGRHISLKQVPSSLILKKMGSYSVKKNENLLLESGFRIERIRGKESNFFKRNEKGREVEIPDPYRPVNALAAMLSMESDEDSDDGTNMTGSSLSEQSISEVSEQDRGYDYSKLVYDDFFSRL
jgi:hypothetical protein